MVEDYVMIELNEHEMNVASEVGRRRMLEALRLGCKDAHGHDGRGGWDDHVNGACGEMAYAKYVGRYWDGSYNVGKRADVDNVQVRTRANDPRYQLYIRPGDPANDLYVLVRGCAPRLELCGWCYGYDAMARPDWFKTFDGRPKAYFVPNAALRPIRELRGSGPVTPPPGLALPTLPGGLYLPNAAR